MNVTVDSPWESQVGRFAYPPIPLLLVRPGRKVTPLAESDRMVPSAGDAVIALIPSG